MKIFDIEMNAIQAINPLGIFDQHNREYVGIYTEGVRAFYYMTDECLNAIVAAFRKDPLTSKQEALLKKIERAQDVNSADASFDYIYYLGISGRRLFQNAMTGEISNKK